MTNTGTLYVATIAISLLFAACKKERYTGEVTVRMTDAPAAFDSVNVEIVEVQMHSDAQGWATLPTEAGIYNLLELQNGIDTVIAGIQQFPAGKATQMRLILGETNYVVAGGMVTPLELSSQDKTGLKINLNYDFAPNVNYEILIDFVASESIVTQGNGSLRLKPVIHTVHIQPI